MQLQPFQREARSLFSLSTYLCRNNCSYQRHLHMCCAYCQCPRGGRSCAQRTSRLCRDDDRSWSRRRHPGTASVVEFIIDYIICFTVPWAGWLNSTSYCFLWRPSVLHCRCSVAILPCSQSWSPASFQGLLYNYGHGLKLGLSPSHFHKWTSISQADRIINSVVRVYLSFDM